jgi:hypothetical protein
MRETGVLARNKEEYSGVLSNWYVSTDCSSLAYWHATGRDAYLKHCEEKVLFSALVLIPVDGEHDSLQQRVNLGH